MKICSRCGIEKDLIEFNKDKDKKDGLRCECKSCGNERNKQYQVNKRIKVGGFIYGITNPAWEGWVKVGRAKDTINRLNCYQTSSPFRDYEIKFYLKVEDVLLVEQFIYNNYEFKNEWVFADFNNLHKEILNFIIYNSEN